ncbi:transcription factor BIM1 isoform X3 [Diospyros lotus]|uniref:transcription factor BIM1 isoform X3 n=1 Tax=Diospyros lotus TaxID=55363 RepID=UPI00224CE40E|nr:transcription factor BIM1 isoform X3 [Diospyros lotus]
MELPQPRPFGAQGRKSTHDFLSLYSPVQDPRPPPQDAYLKTHDFLQPLERLGKNSPKEESAVEVPTMEKPPPPAPAVVPPPASSELLLPGGYGTYSISHVPYPAQRVPKPEGGLFPVAQGSGTDRNEENSNCSAYTGSGFTLWDESVAKKGKTGKENAAGDRHTTREAGLRIGGGGQRVTSERPSQSSSGTVNNQLNANANAAFSSLSSSHTLDLLFCRQFSSQKNQTFMDMLKSAKTSQDEYDDDDEEFVLKKEPSPQGKSDLTVKVDGGSVKSSDQRPNTPRSKHSATEQRRRSKINDRFQMLRELIPHGDQKRDKASFLLEVIEYIQYLQEKVNKYEGSYQGWNQEPSKLMPWRNSHRPAEGFVDQSEATNSGSVSGLMFPAKFDENNLDVSNTNLRNGHNAVESDMNTLSNLKAFDHHARLTNKAVAPPAPLQPNIFNPSGSGNTIVSIPAREASNSQPQSQFWHTRSCVADSAVASHKLKEQELTIESGRISISSAYSQGLLNSLTQALQSSGVDLSQASVSVQIDLGKRANGILGSTSALKNNDLRPSNPTMACSRGASSGEESDQALKRLKTS